VSTPRPLVVHFEALARSTDRVLSWSIDSQYLTSTDGFEVEIYDDRLPRRLELQPVELTLGDSQQALGRVDATVTGGSGATITCRGRDYVADLVECNIDPSFSVRKGDTLGSAIVTAAGPVGIDTVLDNTDTALRNARSGGQTGQRPPKEFQAFELEELKPSPDMGIYEFCSRLAARHGATIQPGARRTDIMLSAPDYSQAPAYAIRRRIGASGSNNVISAEATRDYSSLPSYMLFTSKSFTRGGSSLPASVTYDVSDVIASYGGELQSVTADTVFPGRRKPPSLQLGLAQVYRLRYQQDDDSKNLAQLERVALRQMSEFIKDTLIYTVTLRGHIDPGSGLYWAIDTIVEVDDELAGVQEQMWVASRRFRYDGSSGATTELELWRKGAFQA
jgi:prophage tail gpP-like protein